MPCLNEAETLASCIGKAQNALAELAIPGEIIIADNGSTDGSLDIARARRCASRRGLGERLWLRSCAAE